MNAYADTSFLVSLYFLDANTAQATTAMRHQGPVFGISVWNRLEFENALQLLVFRKLTTEVRAASCLRKFEDEINLGLLVPVALDFDHVIALARRLVARHVATLGIRSLDTLHVAAASALGVTDFFTFDQRQRALAAAEGLQVSP